MKRIIGLLISLCTLFGLMAGTVAMADDGMTVIMNIPYTLFYDAELDLPDDYQVDAVSSATDKVYKNAALVGGSYAVELEDGTHAIQGVSFPVHVADAALLQTEGFSFNEVADAETLASSNEFSYYIPETAPDYYKELAIDGDKVVFGKVQNLPTAEAEGVTPVLDEVKGRRGDYKLEMKGFDFTTDGKDNIVYAVIVRTAKEAYPMRHLENIFGGDELAINAGSSKLIKGVNPVAAANYASIVGQTITEIDYYTSKGYYSFAANVDLPDDLDNKGYVLMNIPYEKFYDAEVTDSSVVDAVTSSTLMKPRTGTLAGGSYHVDAAGPDISGVIFPVYVDDLAALANLGGVEITDESSVDITVTNKGQESTTTYEGQAALFEAPSYSWYVMKEGSLPKQYKTLDMAALTFSAVNKKDKALDASASWIYDKHADLVISVSGAEEKLDSSDISGVVLVADDGTAVGLRHVKNIWRKYQLGFNLDSAEYAALKGKTITSIRYLTHGADYAIAVELPVAEDERLVKLTGTYIDLFPEFAKAEYKDYWMECIKAYVSDDATAEDIYTSLTQTYMGTLKGQEAIDAYSADPASMLFNCYLENGVAKLTISGNVISGVDAEGNELFRHAYHYVGDQEVSFFGQDMGIALHIYQTDDADAGLFTYFAFADDTPGETYHIEFRYGANAENLANYSEGEYAYWLGSGILDGYKESMIQNCIKLFVDENVGGQGEETAETADSAVIEISSAEELVTVNQNLSGHYVLTADIDLGGAEWTPIGTFLPAGESAEEQEMPNPDYAFTGTFDGQGHTISNYTINQPEGWCIGLFGCIANAEVGNFKVDNVKADGALMASAVVGYAFCSTVHDIDLSNATVTAHWTEMSAEGMYGGIVGAGMASLISDCSASADIIIPDGTANAGIVGGGLEGTSVVNCIATGTVSAGNNCYGLGGVSGCGFGAEQFTNCKAENVTITAGDNCFWIGGITGYAGGYEDPAYGTPVTAFTGCVAENVSITTGENTDGISAIVGAGFYQEGLAETYGEMFASPSQFTLTDCTADQVTLNGEVIE